MRLLLVISGKSKWMDGYKRRIRVLTSTSPFDLAFQRAATKSKARVSFDTFEHTVLQIHKNDLDNFLENLFIGAWYTTTQYTPHTLTHSYTNIINWNAFTQPTAHYHLALKKIPPIQHDRMCDDLSERVMQGQSTCRLEMLYRERILNVHKCVWTIWI